MRLRITTARGTIDVTDRAVVTFGRSDDCDVRLEHPLASRLHARLERTATGWVLQDQSANGTFVDGRPITTHPLAPGISRAEMPAGGDAVQFEMVSDAAWPIALPGPLGRPAPGPLPPPELLGSNPLGRLTGTISAGDSGVVTIGRSLDNDLVLDDLTVSRRHAEVHRQAGGLMIIDLGSHNGTYVNGRPVSQLVLGDGDIVGIGGVTLRVRGDQIEQYAQQGSSWLWARDLRALRGKHTVLHDIDLVIEPSSFVAIVGPSGAGKTTLMDALTGNVPANAGTVSYAGRTLATSRDEWKLHLGHVPQDDLLHPQLSVRQALDYTAKLRFPPDVDAATRTRRVEEVLTELGIAHRSRLAVGKLSGGQRKRTSIAVELLTRPSLLFLDEPTSGLDPGKEEQVMALLRELARGGRIVVATTHSLASLEACDRVLFLAFGGQTAYYGPPEEAVAYFRSHGWGDSFPRIFQLLDDDRTIPWAEAYREHPDRARFLDVPMEKAAVAAAVSTDATSDGARRPPLARQTWILVRRYLAIIASERRGVALLLLQAPLFAGLFLLLFGENVMTTTKGSEATMLLWLLVIAVTWLGTSNAIREIVKERPITRREANVGLSMTAYYLSKTIVLGLITTIQVVILAVIALAPQVLPPSDPSGTIAVAESGSVLTSQSVELIVGLVVVGLAAVAVGLALSALMRSSDQAMLVLPLVLVAHVVVSAPLVRPSSDPLSIVAMASSASWGTAATASTVGLNDLRVPCTTGLEQYDESYAPADDTQRASWEHGADVWLTDMAALIAIAAAASALTWVVLRRTGTGKPMLDRQA
jgi:ABC-type multidrug transport system ATPase subunit/pSer/pThr/pTyr-binding forkhead associated (FHA) protein